MKLTAKQQRFVDFYSGNATEAAVKAGYSPRTASFIGSENLKKPYIAAAIADREREFKKKQIATREERQQFWTSFMRDEGLDARDRLKASELLGKSQCDFIEKRELSGPDGGPIQAQSEFAQSLLAEIDGATRGLPE